METIKLAVKQAADKYGDYTEARSALFMIAEAIEKAEGACAYCREPMYGLIRIHHHTEESRDVTQESNV